jgi:hypothetical protein
VEAVSRLFAFAALMLACFAAPAAQHADRDVLVYGKADRGVPGWALLADAPAGWTADCCTYARAIGVNLVMYRGEWTGNPERVMVLNVWPRKLATLGEELAADRKQYLRRDPAAKAGRFPVRHRSMQCEATVYEGTDRFDDVVVFCDPGRATGIRLSWSMTLADADPQRRALLEDFMRVVVGAIYMRHQDATGHQVARR